jgi:hypothetical protein
LIISFPANRNYTNLQWATCNRQAGKAVLAIVSAEVLPQNLIEKGITSAISPYKKFGSG